MVLRFKGKTNSDGVYIRWVAFRLPNEEIVLISRTTTEYVIENGNFDMRWKGCHEIIGQKHNYRISSALLKNAKIVDISFTENAPKGYRLFIDEFSSES